MTALRLADTDDNLYRSLPQTSRAPTRNVRIGIPHANHHPPNPRRKDRLGTLARATDVIARLERDVQRLASGVAPQLGESPQRIDLGMGLSGTGMKTDREHDRLRTRLINDHGTNERVWAGSPPCFLGGIESQTHHGSVVGSFASMQVRDAHGRKNGWQGVYRSHAARARLESAPLTGHPTRSAMPSDAKPAKRKLPRTILPTLRRADPRLAWLIERVGPFAMDAPRQRSHLESLCRSIVYQQLSGKAAATIFSRFRGLWDTAEFPTAAQILQRSDEELRGCGLSFAKLSYLRDLSQRLVTEPDFLADVDALDDEAIITRLTSVRGLGRWTSEMFLMFHLGRLDVWPVGDLGIRKGVQRLHELDELPSPKQMHEIGSRYAPFRSVASWYLWRLLELQEQMPAR